MLDNPRIQAKTQTLRPYRKNTHTYRLLIVKDQFDRTPICRRRFEGCAFYGLAGKRQHFFRNGCGGRI